MGRFANLETPGEDDASGAEGTSGAPTPRAGRRSKPGDHGMETSAEIEYDWAHYRNLADAAYDHGDYGEALKLYSRSAQKNHAQPEPWVGQVLSLIELRNYREGMVWARRGLELFPEHAGLIAVHAMVLGHMGNHARGLSTSDFAVSKSGKDPLVWLARAEVLSLAGNKNSAACIEKAMETAQPDDWRTPMRAGLQMLRQRKWNKAAELLREAASRNMKNDFLWERLGYALERNGTTDRAADAYRAALDLNGRNTAAQKGLRRCGTIVNPLGFLARLFRRG